MKSIEILKKGNEHVKGYIMPIIFTKDGALKLYKRRENSLYIWLKYLGNRQVCPIMVLLPFAAIVNVESNSGVPFRLANRLFVHEFTLA